jgi:AcrR family transcriptional regulator
MAAVSTRAQQPAGRRSSGERRDELIDAAMSEFARTGLHGTTTESIARRAGISQPYVFRFFPTKEKLFLAAVERGYDRVQATWEAAVRGVEADDPGPYVAAMGAAYGELLEDRQLLLLQMQSFAACENPEIRAVVQRRYRQLMRYFRRASGADEALTSMFFAHGMLLNVAAVADLSEIPVIPAWAG